MNIVRNFILSFVSTCCALQWQNFKNVRESSPQGFQERACKSYESCFTSVAGSKVCGVNFNNGSYIMFKNKCELLKRNCKHKEVFFLTEQTFCDRKIVKHKAKTFRRSADEETAFVVRACNSLRYCVARNLDEICAVSALDGTYVKFQNKCIMLQYNCNKTGKFYQAPSTSCKEESYVIKNTTQPSFYSAAIIQNKLQFSLSDESKFDLRADDNNDTVSTTMSPCNKFTYLCTAAAGAKCVSHITKNRCFLVQSVCVLYYLQCLKPKTYEYAKSDECCRSMSKSIQVPQKDITFLIGHKIAKKYSCQLLNKYCMNDEEAFIDAQSRKCTLNLDTGLFTLQYNVCLVYGLNCELNIGGMYDAQSRKCTLNLV